MDGEPRRKNRPDFGKHFIEAPVGAGTGGGPSLSDIIDSLVRLLAADKDDDNGKSAAATRLAEIVNNKGKLGFDLVVPKLINIIKTNKNESARSHTANALMMIAMGAITKNTDLIQTLRDGLKDRNKNVVDHFAIALGEIEDRESASAITELLKNPENRFSAACALLKIGGIDTVSVLLDALKDEREEVRSQIVIILAEIGIRESEAVIPMLAKALENDNENVRLGAARALRTISQEEGGAGTTAKIAAKTALGRVLQGNDERAKQSVMSVLI